MGVPDGASELADGAPDLQVRGWLDELQRRHRASLTTPEFLKAVRALSARYVERRGTLRDKSPLDSAGKRAAFAAFYAPLHFLTAREILRAPDLKVRGSIGDTVRGSIGDTVRSSIGVQRIVDLGCGTGVASAAWALEDPATPQLIGVDTNAWALGEARWNWSRLGLQGEVHRTDLVRAAERLLSQSRRSLAGTSIVAGWSVNELPDAMRDRLLPALLECIARGAAVLVIEPVAGAVSPWWPQWERAWQAAGGAGGAWRFPAALPAVLADVSDAAGFRRDALTAKTLWHDSQTG